MYRLALRTLNVSKRGYFGRRVTDLSVIAFNVRSSPCQYFTAGRVPASHLIPLHQWRHRTDYNSHTAMLTARRYLSDNEDGDNDNDDASDQDNEAKTEPIEIGKLEDDKDLQDNVDEEKEGKELAEDFVKGEAEVPESDTEDDDDKVDENGEISVLDQLIKATESASEDKPQAGEQESVVQPLDAEMFATARISTKQLAVERRRTLFWEYMKQPSKERHILNEILSPKSLEETEEFGIDKSDMVDVADFADFIVDVRSTQKAVASGAILRYRAMVVVGNFQVVSIYHLSSRGSGFVLGKGIVGFGLGKASTVAAAVNRARFIALKNLVAIPLYRQHTIYDAASAKVTATKVMMWPRSRGFGIVANPILSGCCDLIGIRDISIKVIGSKNRFNMIKGFFAALESIPSAIEIAEAKGVYMRELCLFRPPRTLETL